ncbi:MAG: cytidylate kinase-like family protein [Desulfuromonadales bacterium]|nr:cytidylate kinase-like family protein [Desulfuromonadales bacterium]
MPIGELAPSVEQRMKAYHELSHRVGALVKRAALKPTITLSREFGCEAFPVAGELIRQAEKKTGEPWLLVDKSLLDAVAREHHVPEEIMKALGSKPRWFDDMLATFSQNWKSDADYYRLLCEQVVMTASAGNAVIVGLGAAIITKSMANCCHFRLIADHDFKVVSIAKRMKITKQEAEIIVLDRQKERDRIIRKLLDANEHEPLHYHAIFNNGKSKNQQIARAIIEHALGCSR